MEYTNPDVACIGILVADFFAPPLPRLPEAGELMIVDDMLLSTGGCAANTAMDLSKLGVRAAVFGRVGNDIFADFICKELCTKGISISGVRISPSASTSRTIILPVSGQDRRFIHTVGANAELTVDDIDIDLISQTKVLYVGGYLLFSGFKQSSLANLFKITRQRGIKNVLDIAGPRAREGLDPLLEVLPYTDVFLPNHDEAKIITGLDDPFEQAKIFYQAGAKTSIVTMGCEGAVVVSNQGNFRASAYEIAFVDGSGGGDAFDAGFIVGLLEGWDLPTTVKFASAIGASACTELGTTAGVFTREAANTYIRTHPLELQVL
jgi:sugar/nucleoside kinase (ribokinase family)